LIVCTLTGLFIVCTLTGLLIVCTLTGLFIVCTLTGLLMVCVRARTNWAVVGVCARALTGLLCVCVCVCVSQGAYPEHQSAR
jgi:hypothetical protein